MKECNNWKNALHIGNGILDQIKPPEPAILKVEDLYESWTSEYWSLLDELFEDRPDLHDRIKKCKEIKLHENKGKQRL